MLGFLNDYRKLDLSNRVYQQPLSSYKNIACNLQNKRVLNVKNKCANSWRCWCVSAAVSILPFQGDAGGLFLQGHCNREFENWNTGDEPDVAKGPGHGNTFKKQIHARIPKPGRTISSITPKWLIHKIGTDKIAAQAARSWMGAIISSVIWDPKEHHFPSGCSRIEVAGIWMHKCKCEASQMEVFKIQSHTEVVQWKSKVKIWEIFWVTAKLKISCGHKSGKQISHWKQEVMY